MLDKLKFWKSDEVEAAGKASSAAVIAAPAATEAVVAAVAVPLADSTLAAVTESETKVETEAPKSVLVQDIQLPLAPQSIEQPSSQVQQAGERAFAGKS